MILDDYFEPRTVVIFNVTNLESDEILNLECDLHQIGAQITTSNTSTVVAQFPGIKLRLHCLRKLANKYNAKVIFTDVMNDDDFDLTKFLGENI